MIPKTIIKVNTIHTFLAIFISTTSINNYTLFWAKDKPLKEEEETKVGYNLAYLI